MTWPRTSGTNSALLTGRGRCSPTARCSARRRCPAHPSSCSLCTFRRKPGRAPASRSGTIEPSLFSIAGVGRSPVRQKNVTLACSNATGDALRDMGMPHADIAIVEVIPGYHKTRSNQFDQALLLELLRTDGDVGDAIAEYVRESLDAEQNAFRERWVRSHDVSQPPPKWRPLFCGGAIASFVADTLLGPTWERIDGIPFDVLVLDDLGLVCCFFQHPSAHLMAGTSARRRRGDISRPAVDGFP
jgi:hypothetical protein